MVVCTVDMTVPKPWAKVVVTWETVHSITSACSTYPVLRDHPIRAFKSKQQNVEAIRKMVWRVCWYAEMRGRKEN
jgi:hypothetical protein